MSRVTAAFVCALCDPDNPRPASIMCSNNCGRYVCASHAVPRKGPGSAMVCLACAESLGLIDKPRPQPAPEVRPLIEVPPTPPPSETRPAPEPMPTAPSSGMLESAVDASATQPLPPQLADEPVADQPTVANPAAAPPAPQGPVVIDNFMPAGQPPTTSRFAEPEPAPQSAASETIVSQRGNTLQVPKVSPTLGKPPMPIAKPRKALRSGNAGSADIDWVSIAMVIGTIVMGTVGFLFILIAVFGQ